MAYTEVKQRNGSSYFYRVRSIRHNNKFSKKRIYIGKNLNETDRIIKEKNADQLLNVEKRQTALNNILPIIKEILIKNKIKKAGVFGSYAIGEQKKNSDIDILVEPAKGMGFGFMGLQIQLSDALKKKVDLVSYNGLSPHLKDRILNQEVRII